MEISKTEIAILRHLLMSEEYSSSYDIASAAGISRRMVREL